MSSIKKQSIKELLSGDKTRNVLIIAGLISLVLIFASSFFDGDTENKEKDSFSTEQYRITLSEEILSMVTSVEGTGEAKILLTLENSYEYIYLDDKKTLQKVNEPTIRGVVIACQGGDSAVVCQEITELLKTALNIPSTKVCVKKLD